MRSGQLPGRGVLDRRIVHRRAERGAVAVIVAVFMVVLLGLVGLALDTARVKTAGQQLQAASEAGALAAASKVLLEADPQAATSEYSVTRQMAIDGAFANSAMALPVQLDTNLPNSPDGDVVVGTWDPLKHVFTPTTVGANAVKVRARRTETSQGGPVPLIFGPAFGNSEANVAREAVATAVRADPLLIVLNPTRSHALQMKGTARLDVPQGAVQVNSSAKCGAHLVGTPSLHAMFCRVHGTACSPAGAVVGSVEEGADVYPDPLADLLPTVSAWNSFRNAMATPLGPTGAITASGTFGPGYYPGGLDLASSDAVTLEPGEYMFGGGGIKLKGGSSVVGSGVTLFIDHKAEVNVSGSEAAMQLTPPQEGSFAAVTIFHHRKNLGKACWIGGGGLFDVEGIIYVPSGQLQMSGVPGKQIGSVIADTVEVVGTTGYTITGKGVPMTDEPPLLFVVK